MQRFLPLALMTFLVLLITTTLSAQDFPKVDKSPMDMAYYPNRAAFRYFAKTEQEKQSNQPIMRVIYSRPNKKDRKIFGGLEKFGSTWRVGANETTEIEFFKDVTIGDQKIPAGRYTIFAKINKEHWRVILNSDLYGWGSYAYDETKNVADIKVPTEVAKSPIEAFSVVFEEAEDGVHLIMGWDDTVVRVPIQI